MASTKNISIVPSKNSTEIWKTVVGAADGKYEVSSLGRIRSWYCRKREAGDSPRIMTLRLDRYGYPRTNLKNYKGKKVSTVRVHKLMMEAFIGGCPERHVSNHGDHNPANNNLGNLEYVTYLMNAIDRRERVKGLETIGVRSLKSGTYAAVIRVKKKTYRIASGVSAQQAAEIYWKARTLLDQDSEEGMRYIKDARDKMKRQRDLLSNASCGIRQEKNGKFRASYSRGLGTFDTIEDAMKARKDFKELIDRLLSVENV